MPLVAEPPIHRSAQRPPRLQHVVFVDRALLRRRPIDLALVGAAPEPVREAPAACVRGEFLDWLFSRAGLDVAQYGQQTLRRRVSACFRVLRVEDSAAARQILEAQPALIPLAIGALVIGVTSFFRDSAVFDFLRNSALPEMASRRAGLRIWSAGCSDGAELYSIAILMAELGLMHRVEMLGTDCRSDALARARSGVYDAGMLKGMEKAVRERYFRESGGGYNVVDPLRRSTQWRAGNVLRQLEPGQWDVILCRNMAMYLVPEAAAGLWRNLESLLRPGGILVLGKAERPGGTRLSMIAPCVYRRERG